MQITILGATGQVGKAACREAIRTGYTVKVLVRSPDKLGDLRESVITTKGDLLNLENLSQALSGSEAVLNMAGGVKEPDQYKKFQQIANHLTQVMNQQKIERLINISGAVATISGERLEFKRKLMKIFVSLFYKQMKQAQDAFIPIIEKANHISWTFVRPAMILKDITTGSVRVNDKTLPGNKVKLGDLAKFIVEQINSKEWIMKAPMIASI